MSYEKKRRWVLFSREHGYWMDSDGLFDRENPKAAYRMTLGDAKEKCEAFSGCCRIRVEDIPSQGRLEEEELLPEERRTEQYVVWAQDEEKWWKSPGDGYTTDIKRAYRFDFNNAFRLFELALKKQPHEPLLVPIRVSTLPELSK